MDQAAVEYRRFLDGDDAGLEALIRAYKDGLMLFLNSYVQDLAAAEELMEETFVRLVVRRPHFSPHASFKTYLYTIGRRLAVDYLRRTARVTTLPPGGLERAAGGAGNAGAALSARGAAYPAAPGNGEAEPGLSAGAVSGLFRRAEQSADRHGDRTEPPPGGKPPVPG